MIYFITSRDYSKVKFKSDITLWDYSADKLEKELLQNPILQLDTETDMVEDGPDAVDLRKLLVTQFGTIDGKDQYIFDMIDLSTEFVEVLKKVLNSSVRFILFNANFDYKVIYKNLGIKLFDIDDAYIMVRILNSGRTRPKGYHGLKHQLYLEFGIDIDKGSQTSFDGSLLTDEQVRYAALDVKFLYNLYELYKRRLIDWNMFKLYDEYERHLVKIYADMELSPMRFDSKHWLKVADNIEIERDNILNDLEKAVLEDKKLVEYILNEAEQELGHPLIYHKDVYNINWRSSTFRKDAIVTLIPALKNNKSFTVQSLTKLFKDKDSGLKFTDLLLLSNYLSKEYDKLELILKKDHEQFLIDNEYFIKKGTIKINWNSNKEVLFIFQYYYPNLTDTNSKSLARITSNKLIQIYKKYVKVDKSRSTYGVNFIKKYVKSDGTIAPSGISQILSTGRISFGILLQIPKSNLYRNAFLPLIPGNKFIDADYGSIELIIMSKLAGEENFLNIIRSGRDAHSQSASLIFGQEWLDAAEPGCKWMIDGSKCDCPKHKELRTKSKSISFGLAYGLSVVGLAERLNISRTEAKVLFDKYFAAFPRFHKFFEDNARFAVENLYISTGPPLHRKRFFNPIYNRFDEGAIERQAKNAPIQGASADMLKVALVKLYNKLHEHGDDIEMIGDSITIHLPVHDEILLESSPDKEDLASKFLKEAMLEAADMFIHEPIVTLDLNSMDRWKKS